METTKITTDHDIFQMKLHECLYTEEMKVYRVPGGWLYIDRKIFNTTFVPFSKEFLPKEEKPKPITNESMSYFARSILNHLSKCRIAQNLTKQALKETSGRTQMIKGLLKDYEPGVILSVINFKINDWAKNEKMKKYLVPETLFRPSNFLRYFTEMQSISEKTINYARPPKTEV